MASLLSSLSIVSSGLSAVTTQLEITSNNVTNAGTEGYTRKSAVLSAANLGTTGGGVLVSGFSRTTDTALFTALTQATSDEGYRSTQNEYLQQVMDIYGLSSTDDPALSSAVTDLVNAWTALDAEPESSVAQQEVIQSASDLADEIARLAGEIEDLDRQCFSDITSTTNDLNSYLSQVQDLNIKIANAYSTGLAPGALEDSRDQLVLKISELVDVTVLGRTNGQIALYTDSGYQLVDGSSAAQFEYDGTDLVSVNNASLSLNSALAGGKLEALVDFRDQSASAASSTLPGVGTLQKMRSQLDAVAQAFLTTTSTATSGEVTFAQAYDSAATGTGELASSFFTGTNRTDFAINANLLTGTSSIKQASVDGVVDALLDATRSFSASGLSTTGSNYTSLVTSSLTDFQQEANAVSTLNDTASESLSYLSEKYTNETNVNVDDEMITLVTLQNIYTANARVLSVIQDLFTILENLL